MMKEFPTTCSDNAKPWEPPKPKDPALQCQDCGYDKHPENTGYHSLKTYDIKNSCGVCRTSRLDADGLLFCLFDNDQDELVGQHHVCDAVCRLFPWEIEERYKV